MLTLAILDSLGNFALFLAALGFIIFIHELGHFMTAKWVGIKVEQFAVGFGHVVLSYRKGLGVRIGSTKKEVERRINEHLHRTPATPHETQAHIEAESINVTTHEESTLPTDSRVVDKAMQDLGIGETEYSLRWFPMGGFVKMLGQDDLDPGKTSPDPRSYNNKPVWARMIVVSAGVIMNMITAVLFFIVAFMWGVAFPPAIVGNVAPGSSAAQATATNVEGDVRIRPGDRIVSINGDEQDDFAEIRVATALAKKGEPVNLIVERPAWAGQEKQTLRFSMQPKTSADQFLQIGVTQPESRTLGTGETDADRQLIAARFEKYGIESGMQLTAVNGQPVDAHWQYLLTLDAAQGQPVTLTFTGENDQTVTTDIQPNSGMMVRTEDDTAQVHMLGFVPATKISGLTPRSAAEGQLEPGDIIKAVNGNPWPTVAQFVKAVGDADGEVAITVLRDGETLDVAVTPKPTKLWGLYGKPMLGVALDMADDQPYIIDTLPDTPAAALSVMPGTKLQTVNGQPVTSMSDLRRAVENAEDQQVAVTFSEPLAGGTPGEATLTISDDDRAALAELSWSDPIQYWEPRRDMQRAAGPAQAIAIGYDKTVLFLQQTYVTMARLFQGSVSAKHLSGPVGITHAGMTMADRGFAYLFWFMGLISVNLAVINFLPLPIVDGGLFVMLIIEKLRGKPLPVQVQSAITMAGLLLLGAVFLYVTFNDIVRLAGG